MRLPATTVICQAATDTRKLNQFFIELHDGKCTAISGRPLALPDDRPTRRRTRGLTQGIAQSAECAMCPYSLHVFDRDKGARQKIVDRAFTVSATRAR